jgi:DNA excision repair protein ERCC-5
VYKNMFNAAKFVECYLLDDLDKEFSLDREKLIAIAQLLGSDYTTGIPGIGPVTALEILSEFKDLYEFKDWWTGVQEGRIPKEADKSSPFRRRFRRTHVTKMFLPATFPDPRVEEAYLEPAVDNSDEQFQWGVPDLDALRTFLSSQIGWSWERTDEVLVPVVRDMNRREKEGTQSNITRFFDGAVGAGAFAPRVRKDDALGMLNGKKKGKGRMGAALTKLAERGRQSRGEDEDEGEAEAEAQEQEQGGGALVNSADLAADMAPEDGVPARRKRKVAGNAKAATAATGTEDPDDEAEDDDLYEEPRKKPRISRKKKSA